MIQSTLLTRQLEHGPTDAVTSHRTLRSWHFEQALDERRNDGAVERLVVGISLIKTALEGRLQYQGPETSTAKRIAG